MTPGVGWFLYVFLIPFWAMFPIIVIGPKATVVLLAAYVIGYPIAKLVLRAHAVVPKSLAGHEDQGNRHGGRYGFHVGRKLVIVILIVRRRVFRRGRQLGRRGRVRKLVRRRR